MILLSVFAALFILRHFAGPAFFYALFYRRLAGQLQGVKNQEAMPSARQLEEEKRYTYLSSFCDLGVFALSVGLMSLGVTRVYGDFSAMGWGYAVLSFFALMILQDLYFYLTHRLMHVPAFFRHVHFVHHKSKNPNPWSAFSVHPVEKTMELFFFPLMLLVLPLHPMVVAAFVLFSTLINLWGHTGFELNLFKVNPRGLTRLNSTPTFHNMHHEFFRCNYSLYFSFWDKLFKTEHPEYAETLIRLSEPTARR